MTRADIAMCEQAGLPLAGINNAYQITDKLSIHYGCDTKWWRAHWDKLYPGPARYSLKKNDKDQGVTGVTQMECGERQGLSHKWPVICTGGNSGYQAINLLYLLGYNVIILLGYDMQINGQAHWHGDHTEQGLVNPKAATVKGWRAEFKVLAGRLLGTSTRVINCSRETALTCFPKANLEDVL